MNEQKAHFGTWGKLLSLVVILAAATAVYLFGYLPRVRLTKQLDTEAAERRATPPLVNATAVKLASPSTVN